MVTGSKVMVVVLSRDGWDYIVWGVHVSFMIRISRSYLPRLRRVSFGFHAEDGATVMNPTSPSNIAELEIGSFLTLPWGGFQVNGHRGEEVGFTYVPLE